MQSSHYRIYVSLQRQAASNKVDIEYSPCPSNPRVIPSLISWPRLFHLILLILLLEIPTLTPVGWLDTYGKIRVSRSSSSCASPPPPPDLLEVAAPPGWLRQIRL